LLSKSNILFFESNSVLLVTEGMASDSMKRFSAAQSEADQYKLSAEVSFPGMRRAVREEFHLHLILKPVSLNL
jgi:hypothetical protein